MLSTAQDRCRLTPSALRTGLRSRSACKKERFRAMQRIVRMFYGRPGPPPGPFPLPTVLTIEEVVNVPAELPPSYEAPVKRP